MTLCGLGESFQRLHHLPEFQSGPRALPQNTAAAISAPLGSWVLRRLKIRLPNIFSGYRRTWWSCWKSQIILWAALYGITSQFSTSQFTDGSAGRGLFHRGLIKSLCGPHQACRLYIWHPWSRIKDIYLMAFSSMTASDSKSSEPNVAARNSDNWVELKAALTVEYTKYLIKFYWLVWIKLARVKGGMPNSSRTGHLKENDIPIERSTTASWTFFVKSSKSFGISWGRKLIFGNMTLP